MNTELDLGSYFSSFDPESGDPLLNALTSALHDVTPRWNTRTIAAFTASHDEIELNALDLIPLLWANFDKGEELLKLVATRASSKECLIALLEVQEDLIAKVSHPEYENEEEDSGALRLRLLLELYAAVIPRVNLRKKGPLETLTPIIAGLSRCMRLCCAGLSKDVAKSLLLNVALFVSSASSWVTGLPSTVLQDSRSSMDILKTLLFTGIVSLCDHVQSHLAEGFIEQHYPRKYLHTALSSESAADSDIVARIVEAAKSLQITPESLVALFKASQNTAIVTAGVVLLAHWNPPPASTALSSTVPYLSPLLQSGTAIDEVLFLLLNHAHIHAKQPTPLDSLMQPLITLCSTSLDPTQRNTAFVTLSQLSKTLPPAQQLALFTELLSPETDPFPQMRVAAVGLVKEAVSDALSLAALLPPDERRRPVVLLASPQLFAQLGRYLLRAEPPELLLGPLDTFDVDAFLESSEPTRLHLCLSFYYMLLVRDVSNLTGVRDSGSIKETGTSLLRPLANVLDLVERKASEKDESAMIAEMGLINPLRMALIHVHEALETLGLNT